MSFLAPCRMVDPSPFANSKRRELQRVRQGGVPTLYSTDIDRVALLDEVVRAALSVHHQLAELDLITVQALVAPDVRVVQNGERDARKPSHVHFIWANPVASLTELL